MAFRIQNKNSQLYLRALAPTQGAPVFQDSDNNPQELLFDSEMIAGGMKLRWSQGSTLYLCISWDCMDNGGQLFVISNPVAPRKCFTFAKEDQQGDWFLLKVVDSGKYLCVPGSWTAPNVSVTQGSLQAAAPSYRWRFV